MADEWHIVDRKVRVERDAVSYAADRRKTMPPASYYDLTDEQYESAIQRADSIVAAIKQQQP